MPKVQVQGRTFKITVILLLMTLLGTALRFYQLDANSMYGAEMFSTRHGQKEVTAIPASLRKAGAHPPLWHFLTHFVLYLGQREFILRFPAAFMGILSIPLIYVVGQRLFGREVGLLASLLLTLSPFHLQWSQQARMYTAFILGSLFSLYCLWRLLEGSNKSLWISFALSTLLNIYNTYFAFFVLIGEAGFFLVVVGVKSWPGRVKGVTRFLSSWFRVFSSLPQVRGFFLSLIIVGLLYLPWLPVAKVNLLERQSALQALSGGPKVVVSLSLILRLAGDFSLDHEGPLFLIFIGAFLVGLIDLVLRSRWRELLLVGLWLVPPFVIIALLGGVRKLPSRYLIYILPIYLILVAEGATGLLQLLYRFGRRRGSLEERSLVGCGLIAVMFGGLSIVPVREYYAWEKEDWRGAVSYLVDHMEPGDLILCDGGAYTGPATARRCAQGVSYYLSKSSKNRHILATDINISAKIKGQATEGQAVWIVLWHPSPLRQRARESLRTLSRSAEFEKVLVARAGEGEDLVENTISALKTLGKLQAHPEPKFDLYLSLAEIYSWQGDLEGAQSALAAAKELRPGHPAARARWERISGQLQIDTDPGTADHHLALGDLYLAESRAQEAAQEYERALALDSSLDQKASFHRALGDAYLASGRAQEAAHKYERALALEPELDREAWFHLRLGAAYLASGRADEAAQEYEKTLSLEPERDQRAQFHLRLARAYEESGRREEAIAEYERVLELEPDNAAAQRALDALRP